jgi:hypothetical protein
MSKQNKILVHSLLIFFVLWCALDDTGGTMEVKTWLAIFTVIGIAVVFWSVIYVSWVFGSFLGGKIIGPLIGRCFYKDKPIHRKETK